MLVIVNLSYFSSLDLDLFQKYLKDNVFIGLIKLELIVFTASWSTGIFKEGPKDVYGLMKENRLILCVRKT